MWHAGAPTYPHALDWNCQRQGSTTAAQAAAGNSSTLCAACLQVHSIHGQRCASGMQPTCVTRQETLLSQWMSHQTEGVTLSLSLCMCDV